MSSIFHVLELVRRNPSMYLGGDDERRALQLRHLEMLINGYELALAEHGIKERAVGGFVSGFQKYLEGKDYWDMSQGPVAAVVHSATSEAEAWDIFWQHVDAYKKICGELKV